MTDQLDAGMDEKFILTRAGYEALQRELADLQGLDRTETDDLASVHPDNDPSREEAAEFETKVTKEQTDEHIGHLKLVLQHAQIVDVDTDLSTVDPGDRVTLWDFRDKQETQYDLIGGTEVVEGHDGIAVDSPVGQAILGHRVGDVVTVDTPDGKLRYAIRAIAPIGK